MDALPILRDPAAYDVAFINVASKAFICLCAKVAQSAVALGKLNSESDDEAAVVRTLINKSLHAIVMLMARVLVVKILYGLKTKDNAMQYNHVLGDFCLFIHQSPFLNPNLLG